MRSLGSLPAGILTPTLFGFLMVLFRTGALCSAAPIFGARPIPARLRIIVAVMLAYAGFAGAGFPVFTGGTAAVVAGAAVETLIGLSAGLSSRFALDGASAAGQLIAQGMGLSFGASLDPLHGVESTSVGEILSMIATGAALAAGLHRDLVAWLCRSLITVPPGGALEVSTLASAVVTHALSSVALAVRMAFPVMAAVTFGHVALGVIGRTAPQLNISSVGFSITILAGGTALYMVAPAIAEMAANAAREALARGL